MGLKGNVDYLKNIRPEETNNTLIYLHHLQGENAATVNSSEYGNVFITDGVRVSIKGN